MTLLYLVLGSVIIYFGKKVSEKFIDSNENGKNLGFIYFSIWGLFLLRGVSGVIRDIGVYDPQNHNVYDFFWFLILEVLSTVIFIYVSKNKDKDNNINDSPKTSLRKSKRYFLQINFWKRIISILVILLNFFIYKFLFKFIKISF